MDLLQGGIFYHGKMIPLDFQVGRREEGVQLSRD